MKKIVTILLPLLSVLFCVVVGEVLIRVYYYLRWGIFLIDGQPTKNGRALLTLDDQLGWRATENYAFEG